MPADRNHRLSLQLLGLALLIALGSATWAMLTHPVPNSDRYDYLGRAHHVLEGQGARPLVTYPLRFAFDGASQLPPENLTRPPLWPTMIAPALRLGAADVAGVVTAAIGLIALLLLVKLSADRSFGAPAGGAAALALASSFATARALLGGGPELWIALLLMFAWTWNATSVGRGAPFILGSVLGLLPWLHPIGWLYGVLGLVSRLWRTSARSIALAALVMITVGVSWYAQVGRTTGSPFGPLQSQAELAKSLHDAGGLGPYLTLSPVATLDVLRDEPFKVARHVAHDLRELFTHLDGWMAWPFVVLAIAGIRRDPMLALRDLMLLGLAFVTVAFVAQDPRLLVPALPIAAIWSGAGVKSLLESRPPRLAVPILSAAAVLPWLIPLGLTPAPHRGTDHAAALPSFELVRDTGMIGRPLSPFFTDNVALAWRARRPAIFLPDSPATLETLLALPALRETSVMVVGGRDSRWFESERAGWDAWFASRATEELADGAVAIQVRTASTGRASRVFVPEALALTEADRPEDLIEVPSPVATREGLMLQPAASAALLAMAETARTEGIELRIVSAYRSYERQRELFESAVRRHGADQQWVAAPGRSEHQLGLTVDFCDAATQHVLEPTFENTPEGRWLAEHASSFGWIRSYTEENAAQTGYRPEPWHFRWYATPPDQGGHR